MFLICPRTINCFFFENFRKFKNFVVLTRKFSNLQHNLLAFCNMMEEVVQPPAKKGKRTHFPWTGSREFTLVNYILNEKGHLKTATNMVDKFNAIFLGSRSSRFLGAALILCHLTKRARITPFNFLTFLLLMR